MSEVVPTYKYYTYIHIDIVYTLYKPISRLYLTKHLTVLTRAFFNTSLLEPQKPDFSQKKATKVKDHEAPRSQRSKKIWLGKFFLFDFSPNWTILSHLAKVFFSAFFGLLRPLKAIKAKKAKSLLNKCSKTDWLRG